MNQKTKLALIGAAIAAAIVIPLFIQVTQSLLSLQKYRPVAIPSSNPLVASDDRDWQVYTSSATGFSVSYPPEMYPADTPFEGYATTFLITDLKEIDIPEEITPRIQVFKTETPIAEFVAELNAKRNKDQFPEFKKIELNGYEAYQTMALDPEVIFTHTIIGNDNVSYLVELFTIEKENDALKSIYGHMLQSFRIL